MPSHPVVTEVYELKHQQITHYTGNYSQFRATKEATFKQQKRQKERLETDIRKLQDTARTYVIWGARKEKEKSAAADKGFVGARAARLQKRGLLAKQRMLDKMDELEKTKPWLDKHYAIRFPEGISVPTGVCVSVRALTFAGYGKTILRDVDFDLAWGERLALVAANGASKTTLLKLLTAELSPTAGSVLWSKGVGLGYLPQVWTPPQGVTTAANWFSVEEQQDARTMLGALNVKGDSFFQPLMSLSEGQKCKLSLVKLMLS